MGDVATLGQKIRAARTEAGLTQYELGLLIGVRDRDVNRWENDKHRMRDRRRLETIARVTRKPIDFFLDEFTSA